MPEGDWPGSIYPYKTYLVRHIEENALDPSTHRSHLLLGRLRTPRVRLGIFDAIGQWYATT